MNKVTLTKQQAEALQSMLRDGCEKENVIKFLAREDKFVSEVHEPLNNMPILEIAAAIINGYDVEQTPEEKLKDYYDEHNIDNFINDDFSGPINVAKGRRDGILKTLAVLDIEIEGINK
ncbi:hypothetical protein [Salimicrobium album]|uniref:Phage protein n=1 Tax=Salimicrobium album TaxID=50717 RepID=A0A1H3DFI9_9BACI|nr:hypothetical protein [Salimicrobium album]SDX64459.1 hypothetical protein SAMN04488081_0924 [Salimicrobium album]